MGEISGHTHGPLQQMDAANSGSWVSDAVERNTYVEIEDGKMKLSKSDGG